MLTDTKPRSAHSGIGGPQGDPAGADPYFHDDTVTLWLGDALTVLQTMESESIDCCVTSPPYFALRDYGVPGQVGAERTPQAYVRRLTAIFSEVRRVLRPDGTCWITIGDSYAGSWGAQGKAEQGLHGRLVDFGAYARRQSRTGSILPGMPPAKNLLGIPWRVAFALQDAGWYLRSAIVWHKPNGMPESVTDRPTMRHETIFLLSKSKRYWFDLDPIREDPVTARTLALPRDRTSRDIPGQKPQHRPGRASAINLGPTGRQHLRTTDKDRSPGDVWVIPTVPFHGAHYAVFPPEIPRRCILSGCRPGGVVLDPFHGSGTTGMMAQKTGRRYVGIELNADFLDLSLRTRLADAAFPVVE